MENKYLYIVFSSTPYRVGKCIRRFTGEEYNHLSISLEESLIPMYGFARRYYHTPFYGGFVQESLSRYCVNGETAHIKICRLPITREQYDFLQHKLSAMYAQREHYLYNHLSLITVPFGRLIPVKDAYICVEFGVKILHEMGIDLNPRKYYSVGDVEKILEPYAFYTGPIPEGTYDEAYYQEHPLPHPTLTTLRSVLALLPRLGA